MAGLDRKHYFQRLPRAKARDRSGDTQAAAPGTPATHGEKRYYVFSYDWRQDNVATAQELDEFIVKIREDYGAPDLKVNIVAHSMGGMITRYFIRYGTIDVLDDNCPMLIMID